MILKFCAPLALIALAWRCSAVAEPIGEVDTVFKLIGPDHKIVVDAYDDPKVGGRHLLCSRAKTGGIKGAHRPRRRQVRGLDRLPPDRPDHLPEAAAGAGRGPQRAHLDPLQEAARGAHGRQPRNTLVYLTYSDRVIEGSPQNSVTAVPVDRATPIPVCADSAHDRVGKCKRAGRVTARPPPPARRAFERRPAAGSRNSSGVTARCRGGTG